MTARTNAKHLLRRLLRRSGYLVSHHSTLGVSLQEDVDRLSGSRPIGTVFDVGGNFGQSALLFHRWFPTARIVSFEPVPAIYAQMKERTLGYERIECVNVAVGASLGQIDIGIADAPGSHSALLTRPGTKTVNASLTTVDAVMEQRSIQTIDLLKIDVEGFEMQVLRGAVEALAAGRVRFVYVECVFGRDELEPHTSFFDIHDFLTPLDYRFVTSYTQGFRLSDGCSLGNALFIHAGWVPSEVFGRVRNVT